MNDAGARSAIIEDPDEQLNVIEPFRSAPIEYGADVQGNLLRLEQTSVPIDQQPHCIGVRWASPIDLGMLISKCKNDPETAHVRQIIADLDRVPVTAAG